jgi:glycosyltransferase involved in cell wall biosynthesis
MRIAVYHNLPSGGGKRALYEMTRRLAQRHVLDVYTLSSAEHRFCDLRPHCDRHVVFPFAPLPLARRPLGRLDQGIRALDLLRLRALGSKVAAQIDAAGYEVAFVHHCRFGQAPSLLPFLATPSVYYCQEPPRCLFEPRIHRPYHELSTVQRLGNLFDPLPLLYRYVLGRLDRESVRAAGLILVNSAYSRESLYRAYGTFARVNYLGVDHERFRPSQAQREEYVLSVGALVPWKGFDFLIRSLARLDARQRPPLVIVSNHTDARELDYLQQLALETGVKVRFLSQVTDDELVHLYGQARLTLYAPVMEPFGFVPLESMACGTPVAGVREAGVRETILERRTGLLVERDPGLFARATADLLADDRRLDDYGATAVSHVKSAWTWQRSLSQLEATLVRATRMGDSPHAGPASAVGARGPVHLPIDAADIDRKRLENT